MSEELIGGCRLIDLDVKGDARGNLISLEQLRNVPFEIKRAYFLFGTQHGVSRGFHAHRHLSQLAVCVAGSLRMVLDDGQRQQEIMLEAPRRGLLIGPMIWHEMHDFSSDCVLLVLADALYDETDYIREYDEFQKLVT